MTRSARSLPGPAEPTPGEQVDLRIVPRRLVHLPDDRTIAYAEMGSGPDLVAIHGMMMCLEDQWLGPVPALAEHFRVVAVDRPGHGFSLRPRGRAADIWDQAACIRDAVRQLGLERPVILGHSFGGAVALAYGMLYPDEIAGIVSLAPVCFPELRLEHLLFGPRALPLGGELLTRILHASSDPSLLPLLWNAMFLPQAMPQRFRQDFPFALAGRAAQITAEGEDAGWLWPALTRSAMRYSSLRVPTRILCGGADIVVNSYLHGAAAAQMIPTATLEMLPGAGHMFPHTHPDAVVRAARSIGR